MAKRGASKAECFVTEASASGILHGVRVLDFGRYIAGPYCAAMLGDFGADVIRIEKSGGSEDRFIAPVATAGDGSLFLHCNRNKRGITLNLGSPESREIVRKLVATADVVVANLPASALSKLELDYDSLRRIRPQIILTSISGFGSSGPFAGQLAFDGIAQAMSGAVYLSGEPDAPTKSYVNYVDYGTAFCAAYGTVLALFHRAVTGRGQHVDGSLMKTALTYSNYPVIEQKLRAVDRKASGNRGQIAAPYNLYPARDGWVMLQIVGNPLFERVASLLGRNDWLRDRRLQSDQDRADHAQLVDEPMRRWCAERSVAECLAELGAAKIPAGPLLSPQDVLDSREIQASGYYKSVGYPGVADAFPLCDTPVKLPGNPASIRRRPPLLGEHNEKILSELGYSMPAIEDLRRRGVI